ncbi:MAG: cytochrome c maturation protein CcmE [Desulfovibrio sp.]|nr:cytochrome c maturation protein CcmE [Desulfovibrio sp.]
MKKTTRIYLLAFGLLAAGLGYLFVSGLGENSVYFLNVSEAMAAEPDKLRQARLFGLVSPADLSHSTGSLAFRLVDKDDSSLRIPVVYTGIVPDAFKPGAEVIVEGGMNSEGHFRAKALMTKCPSKYQKENRS